MNKRIGYNAEGYWSPTEQIALTNVRREIIKDYQNAKKNVKRNAPLSASIIDLAITGRAKELNVFA